MFASFHLAFVFLSEKTQKKMKTENLNIPVIEKNGITSEKAIPAISSCCFPNNNASVCCSPIPANEDNVGPSCAQPEDGSACCEK
jgi:hypothetical protein